MKDSNKNYCLGKKGIRKTFLGTKDLFMRGLNTRFLNCQILFHDVHETKLKRVV